jgi:hypothetical protein
MSQSFEGPSLNPPPPKSSGGMSVVMILLVVGGLAALVCCGICGGCMYFGAGAVPPAAHAGKALEKVQVNQTVRDRFGGQPELAGLPTSPNASLQPGTTCTVDFDITGPKGKGHVKVESAMTANGPEPKSIKVTAPDGSTINVSGEDDPTDVNTPDLQDIPELDEAK